HGDARAAQALELRLVGAHEIASLEQDLPGGDAAVAAEIAHQRHDEGRLAAPRFADKAEALAGHDVEREARDRRDDAARRPVLDADVPDREQRFHGYSARKISRSPSASRLKPRTSETIAMQGRSAICGQTVIIAVACCTMPPQSGLGGGRPRPRKPRMPMVIVV